jgi:hypothetical protein
MIQDTGSRRIAGPLRKGRSISRTAGAVFVTTSEDETLWLP